MSWKNVRDRSLTWWKDRTSTVGCPMCGDQIHWQSCQLVEAGTGIAIEGQLGKQLTVAAFRKLQKKGGSELNRLISSHGIPIVECPNGDRLPLDYDTVPTFHIGVIGTVAASKSTFIAAILQSLLSGQVSGISGGVPFLAGADAPLERARHTVFNQGLALGTTQSGTEEAALIDLSSRSGEILLRLVFVDAAGEDFRNADVSVKKGFLSTVDGVLFLIDVTELPGVRQVRGAPAPTETPERVLANFLTNLGIRASGELPPLAVVAAKADEVISDATNRVSEFLHSPRESALINEQRLREESQAVWGFLAENVDDENLFNYLDQFSRRSLHYASATGGPVGHQMRYKRRPEPHGVLRPVLAVLAAAGRLPEGSTR